MLLSLLPVSFSAPVYSVEIREWSRSLGRGLHPGTLSNSLQQKGRMERWALGLVSLLAGQNFQCKPNSLCCSETWWMLSSSSSLSAALPKLRQDPGAALQPTASSTPAWAKVRRCRGPAVKPNTNCLAKTESPEAPRPRRSS